MSVSFPFFLIWVMPSYSPHVCVHNQILLLVVALPPLLCQLGTLCHKTFGIANFMTSCLCIILCTQPWLLNIHHSYFSFKLKFWSTLHQG
ncbi:hypothetical protein Lalb_Chr21g0305771 [Lupinus albus]|uniref:Uncharacterized protein n=1 Tax=Lupinus albus TaxID=3870 RepID=A0A6A4NRF2_LUPAL|nr:hypothetical protein Lalb_Chr21g0305771 [Lupinus albus]